MARLGQGWVSDWPNQYSEITYAKCFLPSVEPAVAFVSEHLLDNVTSIFVLLSSVVDLQSGTNDLIWIGDSAGKHLADAAQEQEVGVRQVVLATPSDGPFVLELLVGHELNCSMRDADERW